MIYDDRKHVNLSRDLDDDYEFDETDPFYEFFDYLFGLEGKVKHKPKFILFNAEVK